MVNNTSNPIYVIGHKNPDTDSICSAICYAELKKLMTGENYVPMRCGHVNAETAFVLNYFGVEPPQYVNNVYTQVKDVEYRHINGVSGEMSIKKAWEILYADNLSTLPIVDASNNLTGVITVSDIAKSYMEVYDNYIISTADTPYSNIVETLNGELITGNPDKAVTEGKVLIAAANPDLMESYIEPNDIVILGNRYESQLCAIEMNAQCIIVCDGTPVSQTITHLAEEKNCTIIKTFYDTYTVARLINQSIPIRHFMKTNDLICFSCDDYIKDIRTVMAKKRYQYYPVLSASGECLGLISQRNYLNAIPKRVILVDHNERSQAVNGIDEVELLEIIDHHRLGGLQTMNPVFFRNMPLGCTATIIYNIFRESNLEIPAKVAGLLCAAIISDTLMFRSPTCTPFDKAACETLAQIAGINIEDFALKMFRAGSQLSTKTEAEIFYQDYKVFNDGDRTLAVGQVTAFTEEALLDIKSRMLDYIRKNHENLGAESVFLMLTNIYSQSTILLYYSPVPDAEERLAKSFGISPDAIRDSDGTSGSLLLEGVVSRKKQVVPFIISALKERS